MGSPEEWAKGSLSERIQDLKYGAPGEGETEQGEGPPSCHVRDFLNLILF